MTEKMGGLVNRKHFQRHYKYTANVKMQSVEVINAKAAFN
jgi:hypothetical protein